MSGEEERVEDGREGEVAVAPVAAGGVDGDAAAEVPEVHPGRGEPGAGRRRSRGGGAAWTYVGKGSPENSRGPESGGVGMGPWGG